MSQREREQTQAGGGVVHGADSESHREKLSDILHAILEIGSGYVDEHSVELFGFRPDPMRLHIRLPPPAFFFFEFDSPFLLEMRASPSASPSSSNKRADPLKHYESQIRLCCASVQSPRLNIPFLRRMPRLFVEILYVTIMDLIASPEVMALIRMFLNQIDAKTNKLQMLELYLMSKGKGSPVAYLFPNTDTLNPYVKHTLEHAIFRIGNTYDMNVRQQELSAMAGVAFKKNLL